MKGGLIVILHALAAFENTMFAEDMGWDVLINSDEEIGSPASASLFKNWHIAIKPLWFMNQQ